MKHFARLFGQLDQTSRTGQKVEALSEYLLQVPEEDAVWAISLLCGRRPRRTVTLTQLRSWCSQVSGVPEWLFAECYDFVGDLAETIALLLPLPLPQANSGSDLPLHHWIQNRLLPLRNLDELSAGDAIKAAWNELDQQQRLVFNKLLTGGFRVGVSQKLVVRAIAAVSGIDPAVIAHRLMGEWNPTPAFYRQLIDPDTVDADISRPYPFCLAHPWTRPIDQSDEGLPEQGPIGDWLIEWKWDGIRAQLVRRNQQTFLWSRGDELLNARFPELQSEAAELPDGTVLDGEIVAWRDGSVAPFTQLQKRLGRKSAGRKLQQDIPVRFIAFDLLENRGSDLRCSPLAERHAKLHQLMQQIRQKATRSTGVRYQQATLFDHEIQDKDELAVAETTPDNTAPRRMVFEGSTEHHRIVASPVLSVEAWQECIRHRAQSRRYGVEGLMLKRMDSPYAAGRVNGLWWKWKIEPYCCDAVLVYAQRGHGRRAGLYTDYTFAAWQNGELVPFARAYSGLTDEEIRQVDRFVQANTVERFGPACRVTPELVFELAFEGLQVSSRHKSGIALRFPRILRFRDDKTPEAADSIDGIKALVSHGNC